MNTTDLYAAVQNIRTAKTAHRNAVAARAFAGQTLEEAEALVASTEDDLNTAYAALDLLTEDLDLTAGGEATA